MKTRSALVVGIVVTIIGCSSTVTERRIDNIERIFMHQPGYFTVLISQAGTQKLSEMELRDNALRGPGATSYVTDVPEGKPMWATYQEINNGCDATYMVNIVLHIHNASDVNGGGWDYGKFGKGQTNVVN